MRNVMIDNPAGISRRVIFFIGNRNRFLCEEDTTETPMYVNRGGRLTILQEDQGQLLTLAGEPDGKLRAAGH
mgnify:CR=1 FL=1